MTAYSVCSGVHFSHLARTTQGEHAPQEHGMKKPEALCPCGEGRYKRCHRREDDGGNHDTYYQSFCSIHNYQNLALAVDCCAGRETCVPTATGLSYFFE